MRRPISEQIRRGELPQGYELTEADVGCSLDWQGGFGPVRPFDVGKRVWLRDYGLTMENQEQRDRRLQHRARTRSGRHGYGQRGQVATPPDHARWIEILHDVADRIERDLGGTDIRFIHAGHTIGVISHHPDVDVDYTYGDPEVKLSCRRGLFPPQHVRLDATAIIDAISGWMQQARGRCD